MRRNTTVRSTAEARWSETTINELQFQVPAMLPLYSCNVKIRLSIRACFKLAIVCVSDNLNDVMKEI